MHAAAHDTKYRPDYKCWNRRPSKSDTRDWDNIWHSAGLVLDKYMRTVHSLCVVDKALSIAKRYAVFVPLTLDQLFPYSSFIRFRSSCPLEEKSAPSLSLDSVHHWSYTRACSSYSLCTHDVKVRALEDTPGSHSLHALPFTKPISYFIYNHNKTYAYFYTCNCCPNHEDGSAAVVAPCACKKPSFGIFQSSCSAFI